MMTIVHRFLYLVRHQSTFVVVSIVECSSFDFFSLNRFFLSDDFEEYPKLLFVSASEKMKNNELFCSAVSEQRHGCLPFFPPQFFFLQIASCLNEGREHALTIVDTNI